MPWSHVKVAGSLERISTFYLIHGGQISEMDKDVQTMIRFKRSS